MKDIQNVQDDRNLPIQKVGIKGLQYPVTVLDRKNESQHTVADISMFVDLPHHFKGTHMSRFIEVMNDWRGSISVHEMGNILTAMISKFDSETAHIDISFPYFIEKTAPVSGATSLMKYDCTFAAEINRGEAEDKLDLIIKVAVPVTSLCPCSREISDRGAHNQRSTITLQVRSDTFVWLEDLIEVAESTGSAPLYPLLKREDEKMVTELAYDHPLFAEDIVRNAAIRLRNDPRITWFRVETENQESIHDHNAYASIIGSQ